MTKLISIIPFLLAFSISTTAQNTDRKYFEGEVYFNVSCKSLDSRFPQEFLERETGNLMVGKVKRNKYLMYQNTSGELGKTKMIFLLEEGIGYIEYEKSDTIIQFSLEENADLLLSIRLNEEDKKAILGDTCKSITIKYIPKLNYDVIEYVEARYYFNPNFPLDRKMYAKHEMGFWNKFVELGEGGISVRNEILTYPLFNTVYEVTAIVEKEISDDEFEVSKAKVIQEREIEE